MVLGRPDVTLRVARVLAPVTVLGPGRRVGLWVQGCGLRCEGCASVDTWDRDGGADVPLSALVESIDQALTRIDGAGLTITGGEPTDQPEELAEVVTALRSLPRWGDLDVLVFTGRSLAAAERHAPRLVALADVLVAGPYDARRPGSGRLLASGNQTLHVSARAAERYREWLAESDPAIQVVVDEGDIQLVGLPRPGDLDRFRAGLASRGVSLEEVSWRS